jgi:hypothetical protein
VGEQSAAGSCSDFSQVEVRDGQARRARRRDRRERRRLLATRVLAERYARVTVIDRDVLPAAGEGRRAVPQGRHVHALLPRGQACMEGLLPGLAGELVGAGAVCCEPLTEMRFAVAGHQLARTPVGVRALLVSRPLLEGRIRARVAALANVEVVDRCDVRGLLAAERGDRVAAPTRANLRPAVPESSLDVRWD